jgi:hypothetical protein
MAEVSKSAATMAKGLLQSRVTTRWKMAKRSPMGRRIAVKLLSEEESRTRIGEKMR